MKYIGDNKLRTVLEKKTNKRIVNIERPYFHGDKRALRTPNDDIMILVYESQEEMIGPLPTQEEALSLTGITNEKIYALMQKAGSDDRFYCDHYIIFSTEKEWLEDYQFMFDADLGVVCVEIDDFAKKVKPQGSGESKNSQEAQRGE